MRLNAYLARAGVASRRKADELIKAGRVTVNGEPGHLNTFVAPVDRLDADTTGALLLTNDGLLAHRLGHPRYGVEKVYEADVEGETSDEALERLRAGIALEDGPTAPAEARRLGPS